MPKYIVDMEWQAGENQYEPLELLALLREAVGMDGYDIDWHSCEAINLQPTPAHKGVTE